MRPSNDSYYLSLLAGVAARSTCLRRQVGAIITDENHRVLAMGFNGVPRGFMHCGESFDALKNGQTMVLRGNYDGSNIRISAVPIIECQGASDPPGDTRRCMAVHAEINALLTCGHDMRYAHTMYVSCSPCKQCALAIANTNIKKIFCLELYADDAREVLKAARIEVLFVPNKESV